MTPRKKQFYKSGARYNRSAQPALLGGRPVSKYEDTPQAARARLIKANPASLTPMQAALLRVSKGESK
jgi:hypothetical protein